MKLQCIVKFFGENDSALLYTTKHTPEFLPRIGERAIIPNKGVYSAYTSKWIAANVVDVVHIIGDLDSTVKVILKGIREC